MQHSTAENNTQELFERLGASFPSPIAGGAATAAAATAAAAAAPSLFEAQSSTRASLSGADGAVAPVPAPPPFAQASPSRLFFDDPDADGPVDESGWPEAAERLEPGHSLAEAEGVPEGAAAASLIPRERRRALVADFVRRRNAAAAHNRRAHASGLREALASVRRRGALPAPPVDIVLPRWIQALPESHEAWWSGGFLFCQACGGASTTEVGASLLLARPCRREASAPDLAGSARETFPSVAQGSRGRLRALLAGRLPAGPHTWPDDARAPTERAVPVRLECVAGLWSPSVHGADADEA